MKVLIADKFEKSGLDGLRRAGCEVVYQPDLKDDALAEAIARDAAPTCWSCARRRSPTPMLDAGRLALVVRAGAGYNTIDVAAASTRGIYVSNCPGKNAIAVAELTFGADPRARPPHPRQRRRAARRQVEQEGVLEGARPARPDARRCSARQHRAGDGPGAPQAFGMNVVRLERDRLRRSRRLPIDLPQLRALRPRDGVAARAVVLAPTPAEVAAQRDILSVHLALNDETRASSTPTCSAG